MLNSQNAAHQLIERKIKIAKAINGPYLPVASNKYTLDDLREIRWKQLSSQEQGILITQATSLLREFQQNPHLFTGVQE